MNSEEVAVVINSSKSDIRTELTKTWEYPLYPTGLSVYTSFSYILLAVISQIMLSSSILLIICILITLFHLIIMTCCCCKLGCNSNTTTNKFNSGIICGMNIINKLISWIDACLIFIVSALSVIIFFSSIFVIQCLQFCGLAEKGNKNNNDDNQHTIEIENDKNVNVSDSDAAAGAGNENDDENSKLKKRKESSTVTVVNCSFSCDVSSLEDKYTMDYYQ